MSMILMTGCMPFWVHDYYSPSAEEGIVKKSTCYESSGPPDTIEFKRDGVTIKVIASELETGVYVFVRLHIPKGKTVRLESPTVRISTTPGSITADGSFSPNLYTGQAPWKINEAMIGDTKESTIGFFGPKTYDNYYSIGATVIMDKSDKLIIYMPAFYINDKKVQLPEIHFKKDKYLELFAPINC